MMMSWMRLVLECVCTGVRRTEGTAAVCFTVPPPLWCILGSGRKLSGQFHLHPTEGSNLWSDGSVVHLFWTSSDSLRVLLFTGNMKSLIGALLLLLAATLNAQEDCQCATHLEAKCAKEGVNCACTLQVGPDSLRVDCSKLLPKCLLMKREAMEKEGRRIKHDFTVIDNDGLYNPDCEDSGVFHARQCNGTDTCWCVNSAGVRRTNKKAKSDESLKCDRLVRTFWIEVRMKLNDSEPENEAAAAAFKEALTKTITDSYKLPRKHISIELEGPFVYVDLKQNISEKAATDPDIADVAYYMEKDIKRISSLPLESQFNIVVNGKSVGVKEPLIAYIDSERPEISMMHLTVGVIAVIVVMLVAIVAAIVILVVTSRKCRGYKKVEVKEMREMQPQLVS